MSDRDRINYLEIIDNFLAARNFRTYQEDLFEFDPRRGVYNKVEDGAVRSLLLAELEAEVPPEKVTAAGTANLLSLLKDRMFLRGDLTPPFSIQSMEPLRVIVCRNGIINLDRGVVDGRWTLDPHSPNIFALGAVDYDYDPTATCPRFDALLRHVCSGDQDVARMIVEFSASVFARPDIAFEAVLWLTGRGRDGKSTLFRALRHVIGEDVTSAVGLEAFTAGNTFRTWPLLHKVANFASDAVIDDRSNFAALNAWVSRDPVTIHRKFRESVTVLPTAVLFFASNAEPIANDPSDAFWRRLRLVKCTRQVAEHDVNPRLSEELFEEAPGILNRILAALPVIEETKAIFMPDAVRRNVLEIRAKVGSFREYAAEELERGTDEDFILRDHVVTDYRTWALRNNLRVESIRQIRPEMERLFGSKDHRRRRGENGSRVYVWSGVRWRDHACHDDPQPDETVTDHDLVERDSQDTSAVSIDSACHSPPSPQISIDRSNVVPSLPAAASDDDDEGMAELIARLSDDDEQDPFRDQVVSGGAAT